jgi:Haem-binding domain
LRRAVRRGGLALGVAFLAIQLVPYGWGHSNPPVVEDAPWPDAEAARLARDACYDCHSNETDWPLYSYVAPMSWLVRRDVERGRHELNFSEWDRDAGEADDAVETLLEGSMPPTQYRFLHPDARLSAEDVDRLVAVLEQMDQKRD